MRSTGIDHKHLSAIGLCLLVVGGLTPTAGADERAQRAIEVQLAFEPSIQPVAYESRIIDRQWIKAVCEGPQQQAIVRAWLDRRDTLVLDRSHDGLTLHFFAEGIKAMTPADRLWEGLPRRADSLQDLVDHAIRRARGSRRPIHKLIITGHAGLPGCSALGGTLRDCTFEGRLSPYQTRQLSRLRPYLCDDAEIELRQCGTGNGPEGTALLRSIHIATGAMVSSYLSDFHFGDSAAHPRIQFSDRGVGFDRPRTDGL